MSNAASFWDDLCFHFGIHTVLQQSLKKIDKMPIELS